MFLKRLKPYLFLFLLIESLLRASLYARAAADVDFSFAASAQAFLRGLWFDTVTAGFFLLPIGLYSLLLPARLHGTKRDRAIDGALRLLFCFILLFDAVAEHLFWTEFNTRFNFIAVDYLVYTQEVIGNIVESYPVGWLVLCVAVLAALAALASRRLMPLPAYQPPLNPPYLSERARNMALAILACVALYTASSMDQMQFGDNAEAQEISSNGIYNLFYAFWNNEIRYDRFYATNPSDAVAGHVRQLLHEPGDVRDETAEKLNARYVAKPGPERHKNVIIVSMESMSASYMGTFGSSAGLTPNLDRLAKEGLLFANNYATGTRTVRGLEAIALSIPPTPGQSLLRRPDNGDLFSLGFVFRDRGYDTKFLYGGYGYFDNMNAFFSANGFSVVDRTDLAQDEIHFANVWGVCDEDLFARALREADASFKAGKPFMQLIMTTSNHRPYTYPDGKIDIPSHTNRLGGVKYADYSVGRLIEEAKKKPWFKDTVFVFVADHTAGAGGKAELDPQKYHIPMMFYAPGFIAPQRFDNISSQIDLAPILLGQLNFSYYSKFYGEDLMHDTQEIPHAFISNFQKVALVKDGKLTILAPKRSVSQVRWPDAITKVAQSQPLIDDAIAYYQSASWWKERYKRIPTVKDSGHGSAAAAAQVTARRQ